MQPVAQVQAGCPPAASCSRQHARYAALHKFSQKKGLTGTPIRTARPFQTRYSSRWHIQPAALGVATLPRPPGSASLPEKCELRDSVRRLEALVSTYNSAADWGAKLELLWQDDTVVTFSQSGRAASAVLQEIRSFSEQQQCMILCLPAMGQEHVLLAQPTDEGIRPALLRLAEGLARVDDFFSSLGGLPWYQLRCLRFIAEAAQDSTAPAACHGNALAADSSEREAAFHMPTGVDLEHDADAARRAAAQGIQSLPYTAEIWPIGGAGDRLGLMDEETGESVPTAMLPYCGRTLLEGLLRDVQAREALYWRLTGRQVTTPLALMTSDAKGNHRRIAALLQALNWAGRGAESFRLFRQPMVPVVGVEGGRWPLAGALAPMMKPGGHGAIWKLMLDEGIFSWLSSLRREAALVRQISNPMAGTDCTLLALAGTGYMGAKLFGFASCPRAVGASEGMNVLAERPVPVPPQQGGGWGFEYGITNIEYTEFKRLGIQDEAQSEGSTLSVFPANTNILYLSLKAAEAAVRAGAASGGGAALPGLIFNGSKCVEEPNLSGSGGPSTSTPAGRLECTMQNLADSLAQRFPGRLPSGRHADLHTFALFNTRRKVTSSAKRRRLPGSTALAQTPDGSFRDLMLNARDLLLNHCGFAAVPEVGEVQEYLDNGPNFIFLFHPALGPLWEVVGQKLRGGCLAPRSELVLEVASAAISSLDIDGSLIVTATQPLGHLQPVAPHRDAPLPVPLLQPRQPFSATSHDSLEGLYHDDSCTSATAEYITSSPPGSDSSSSSRGGISSRNGSGHEAADVRQVFSDRCGRVRLSNVRVRNAGIDWEHPDNVYWRHRVARRECARITLHGNAEFEAADVTLAGDCHFEVAEGQRMRVTAGPAGCPLVSLEPLAAGCPSWDWAYDMAADGRICLSMRQSPAAAAATSDAAPDDINISGFAPWWAAPGEAASGVPLPMPGAAGGHLCRNGSGNGTDGGPHMQPLGDERSWASWTSAEL